MKGAALPPAPRPQPNTRREKAEARRQQIIDAALNLFAQHGFAATSTKRIAQEVGVTEGLIFHYFPSKGELLLAAASQRRTFMGEALALLQGAEGKPARDLLDTIVLGWVEAIQRQSDIVTMLLVESQTNEELAVIFGEVVSRMVEAMSAYLASRVQAGELRADLPVRTSAMMFFSSLMMFFLTSRGQQPSAWRERASAFTAEMLDAWFRGALAPGIST